MSTGPKEGKRLTPVVLGRMAEMVRTSAPIVNRYWSYYADDGVSSTSLVSEGSAEALKMDNEFLEWFTEFSSSQAYAQRLEKGESETAITSASTRFLEAARMVDEHMGIEFNRDTYDEMITALRGWWLSSFAQFREAKALAQPTLQMMRSHPRFLEIMGYEGVDNGGYQNSPLPLRVMAESSPPYLTVDDVMHVAVVLTTAPSFAEAHDMLMKQFDSDGADNQADVEASSEEGGEKEGEPANPKQSAADLLAQMTGVVVPAGPLAGTRMRDTTVITENRDGATIETSGRLVRKPATKDVWKAPVTSTADDFSRAPSGSVPDGGPREGWLQPSIFEPKAENFRQMASGISMSKVSRIQMAVYLCTGADLAVGSYTVGNRKYATNTGDSQTDVGPGPDMSLMASVYTICYAEPAPWLSMDFESSFISFNLVIDGTPISLSAYLKGKLFDLARSYGVVEVSWLATVLSDVEEADDDDRTNFSGDSSDAETPFYKYERALFEAMSYGLQRLSRADGDSYREGMFSDNIHAVAPTALSHALGRMSVMLGDDHRLRLQMFTYGSTGSNAPLYIMETKPLTEAEREQMLKDMNDKEREKFAHKTSLERYVPVDVNVQRAVFLSLTPYGASLAGEEDGYMDHIGNSEMLRMCRCLDSVVRGGFHPDSVTRMLLGAPAEAISVIVREFVRRLSEKNAMPLDAKDIQELTSASRMGVFS